MPPRSEPQYGRLLNFKVTPDLDKRIRTVADVEKRTVSDVVRGFVLQGLELRETDQRVAVNA